MNFRRGRTASDRATERRRREDEAPRLATLVPDLESLRIEMTEKRGDVGIAESSHIKRVVVEHGPALFVIPCGESSCRDGGHDITRMILRGLESKLTEFEGNDPCMGQTGSASCARTLVFKAVATYKR